MPSERAVRGPARQRALVPTQAGPTAAQQTTRGRRGVPLGLAVEPERGGSPQCTSCTFTEQPDSSYPEPLDAREELGTTRLMFSNGDFNPALENPVAAAESLSMVDMLSKGRLVAGIVRGGGAEQFANNANPAFSRDRFIEAHDLIVKTWTEPGPWRREGDHYQFRVVNPWAMPLQKPHPYILGAGHGESRDDRLVRGASLPVRGAQPRSARSRTTSACRDRSRRTRRCASSSLSHLV